MPSAPTPSPATISASALHRALELYPSLVEKVYASKLKHDAKRVREALERDRWRFETLPGGVADRRTENGAEVGGLSKEEVERLVQWKITHGHSRPFLPAMVRKNEASVIEKQISLAFAELTSTSTAAAKSPQRPSLATVNAALDTVCKLNGIGPATGTLILSIFDPEHIPFFQDEMFVWFFPDSKGEKLKYSLKEYRQLFEAVAPVLERLGFSAVELEKVAYVLGHVDVLGEKEREGLEGCFGENEEGVGKADDGAGKGGAVDEKDEDSLSSRPTGSKKAATVAKTGVKARAQKEPTAAMGRKRASKDEASTEGAPAPKRRSQRNM